MGELLLTRHNKAERGTGVPAPANNYAAVCCGGAGIDKDQCTALATYQHAHPFTNSSLHCIRSGTSYDDHGVRLQELLQHPCKLCSAPVQ